MNQVFLSAPEVLILRAEIGLSVFIFLFIFLGRGGGGGAGGGGVVLAHQCFLQRREEELLSPCMCVCVCVCVCQHA